MRLLTQIFSVLITFVMYLSVVSASTPDTPSEPSELLYVKAYDVVDGGRDFFRIEIGLSGTDEPEYDVRLESSIGYALTVELDNTIPGTLTRHRNMTSNIEYNIEPATEVVVKEVERGKTQLTFGFDKSIDDRSFRTRVEKANRAENQPTRLMIDIDNYVFIDEAVPEYEIGSGAIVIDPGHGGSDSGASGPTGVREKDVSLGVALKLRALLEAQGDPVIMTRTTDRDVHSPQATNTQELQARVSAAPRDAAMFISIHCNAFSNPASHGMETYYYEGSGRGRRLAKLINEELERAGGLMNRGVKSANFYVLKHSPMPATLLELGFVTNPEEEQLLADEDYQEALAGAIVLGINRYFGRAIE